MTKEEYIEKIREYCLWCMRGNKVKVIECSLGVCPFNELVKDLFK